MTRGPAFETHADTDNHGEHDCSTIEFRAVRSDGFLDIHQVETSDCGKSQVFSPGFFESCGSPPWPDSNWDEFCEAVLQIVCNAIKRGPLDYSVSGSAII